MEITEATDVQKQMAHDDSLIGVLQNDIQRLRNERDDWRRKHFEMSRAHSNGVDNIGELTVRILLRERELSERSSDKSAWEQRALKAEAAVSHPTATDKYLNPISAYDALHAIDAELHMVTQHGCRVGEPYDQISAEHVAAAKMMVEALIKSQNPF